VELDVSLFNETIKVQSIGRFSPKVIEFILSKKTSFTNRISSDNDILFWAARVKHTERHRKDFASDDEFEQCLKEIPLIIQNPDYISIHPTDESISFIKKYTKHVSVAIKISIDGKMVYRTMYPLREEQLNEYIANGRAWKYT